MEPPSITCFGVGDGWPSADRDHSSFLYRVGTATFLIDCGEPVSRAFKATGLDYNALDQVFLTHLHFDHVGGLFMLIQGLWLETRTRNLDVHLPGEGIVPIRQMLHAGYIFDDLLPFRLRYLPLSAGERIRVGKVRVTPYATTHLEGLRAAFQKRHPKPFAAYSFLIEAPGLRVAHSGDVGDVRDLEPLLRRPVDLLVCELAHMPLDELVRYLRDQPVKRVAFIHLARPLWADLARTRRTLRASLGGMPFSIARGGEVIRLDSP